MAAELSVRSGGLSPGAGAPIASGRVLQRQRIVLLHREDVEPKAIAAHLGCSESTVYRWQEGTSEDRGLEDRVRSGRPKEFEEEVALRLIALFCQSKPVVGSGRWSLRWMEKHLKNHPDLLGAAPSRSEIQRLLASHQLQPHRKKYFLHVCDPDFFPKMERLIALYKSRPQHLYCYDECPGIQVLQRLAPALLSHKTEKEQRKWLEEFEYIRHGTMDLLAFLEVRTGKVYSRCRKDHTKKTFLGVFEDHVKSLPIPPEEPIHFIMDNLAAHYSLEMCARVASLSGVESPAPNLLRTGVQRREWLQRTDKRLVVCFTPFHGSWLNLIEIWFGILGQHALSGSFASPDELRQAIVQFVEFWNAELAHGFNWTYEGEGLHQKSVSRLIRMLQLPRSPIPVRFLVKQLKLMANLSEGYWSTVPQNIWVELQQALAENSAILNQAITDEDKPRRKKQAANALALLMDRLEARLSEEQALAA